MKKSRLKNPKFTDKEWFALWAAVTSFKHAPYWKNNLVTQTLAKKLFDVLSHSKNNPKNNPHHLRNKFRDKYEVNP